MSKSKRKNRSETEHIRGYIRELEKEIRSLRGQLKQYEKYERSQDSETARDREDTFPSLEVPKLTKPCESCGKGTVIETLEIMGKIYGTCNVCDYKERMK